MKRYILPIAALLIPLAPRAGGIECLTNDVPSADEVTIPPVRGAGGGTDEEIDESYLTLATPPADLTTTTYRMEAFETSVGKNLDYHVQLGFDGNDVWIQGISEAFPESWVKGEMEGDLLIIGMDQYLGVYDLNGTNFNIWVTGINHDKARFEEPQFTYNPNTGIFTQIDGNWLVVNGSLTEWRWLNNMSDIMLSPVTDEEELVDHYALVTPPTAVSGEPLATTTFTASGFDYSFGAPEAIDEYPVELGFATSPKGELEVYVRGLFADMPEAWVKGTVSMVSQSASRSPQSTLDSSLLTFNSPQYLGQWFGSLDCWLMGVNVYDESTSVTFTYDADLNAFVQDPDVRIYFNDVYNAPSSMALQMLGDLTLKGDCSGLLDSIMSPACPSSLVSAPSYNLTGQPVARPGKGLYVTGRKKVVW